MSKQIPLTKGKYTIVDDKDYEIVSKYKWYFAVKSKQATTGYAVRDFKQNKDVVEKYGSRHITMHRFLLNPNKDELVDHKNRDGLDNRRENLRLCNKAQNTANIKKRSSSRSMYKGIEKTKLAKSWTARIKVNNKRFYLGSFPTPQEAALAYNEAAIKHFGEFAYLNKI